MKEYIQNYEKWLKEILKQELNNDEANKLANYHKTQIQFLQQAHTYLLRHLLQEN